MSVRCWEGYVKNSVYEVGGLILVCVRGGLQDNSVGLDSVSCGFGLESIPLVINGIVTLIFDSLSTAF